MFLLSLLKHIYKSPSFGLRNLEREDKNGTRLVLRLSFGLENWTFLLKPSSSFCFIIISTIYKFWSFELYIITNLLCYWLCCRFASKVIMFQETLQFRFVIVLCYIKHIILKVTSWMLPCLTLQISQIIVDCLSPIVSAHVLNQSVDIDFLVMLYIRLFLWVWNRNRKTKLFLHLKA